MNQQQQDREFATELSHKIGHDLYEAQHSGSSARHCARQLDRRSYYYSSGTRRFFGSRVSHVSTELEGLLLCTVELLTHPTHGRCYRSVVFDLMGTVIYRTENTVCKSLISAKRDLKSFINSYTSPTGIYSGKSVQDECDRVLNAEINRVKSHLKALTRKAVK